MKANQNIGMAKCDEVLMYVPKAGIKNTNYDVKQLS